MSCGKGTCVNASGSSGAAALFAAGGPAYSCECPPGLSGEECRTVVACAFWDEGEGYWSTEGCAIVVNTTDGANSSAGLLTCACDHLSSFAVIEYAEPYTTAIDVASTLAALCLKLPNLFDLPEFVDSMRAAPAGVWVMWFFILLALMASFALARLFDDMAVHRAYLAQWSQTLQRWRIPPGQRHMAGCADWALHVFSVTITWYLTIQIIFKVFFFWPWERLTHVHRLLVVYNVIAAQACVVLLFWSTYSGDTEGCNDAPQGAVVADDPSAPGSGNPTEGVDPLIASMYALVFNLSVTVLLSAACTMIFRQAIIVLAQDGAKRTKEDINAERVAEQADQGWVLVFRQTARRLGDGGVLGDDGTANDGAWRNSARTARGTQSAWDMGAEQFADLSNASLARFRDETGMLEFRMWWEAPRAKFIDADALFWTQRASPLDDDIDADADAPADGFGNARAGEGDGSRSALQRRAQMLANFAGLHAAPAVPMYQSPEIQSSKSKSSKSRPAGWWRRQFAPSLASITDVDDKRSTAQIEAIARMALAHGTAYLEARSPDRISRSQKSGFLRDRTSQKKERQEQAGCA